jgi:hypothetical protein
VNVKLLELVINSFEFISIFFWLKVMKEKSGMAVLYISCRTDRLELDTTPLLMKIVSLAWRLMKLDYVIDPSDENVFVDPIVKPNGRHNIVGAVKMSWGGAVIKLGTLIVNFPLVETTPSG